MRLFVVGAGASAAAPARLPVFAVLRGYLLDRLQLSASSAGLAELLAPERFMQSIFDGGLPLAEWLSETLGQGRPNAVHHVLPWPDTRPLDWAVLLAGLLGMLGTRRPQSPRFSDQP